MITAAILTLIGTIVLMRVVLELRGLYRLSLYKKQNIRCRYFPILGILSQIINWTGAKDQLLRLKLDYKDNTDDFVVWNDLEGKANIQLLSPDSVRDFAAKEPHCAKKIGMNKVNVFGFGTNHGPDAMKARRLYSKMFHTQNLKLMCPNISEIMLRHILALEERVKNAPGQELVIDLRKELIHNLMIDVTSYTLFGAKTQAEVPVLPCGMDLVDAGHHLIVLWLETFLSPLANFTNGWNFTLNLSPTKRKIFKLQRDIVKEAINEYRKRLKVDRTGHVNYLNLVADHNTQMENEGTPELKMPLEDIGVNLGLFLITAADTTTQISTNLLCQLSEREKMREKLAVEVKDLKIQNKTVYSEELDKLDYLHCCFMESMRHYPPLMSGFYRELVKDTIICGKTFYKGDRVAYSMMSQAVREADHKDSFSFNPERFSKENKKKIKKNSYIPFLAGHRICVGQYMAEMNVKLICGLMTKFFEIEKNTDFNLELVTVYTVANPKVKLRLRNRS